MLATFDISGDVALRLVPPAPAGGSDVPAARLSLREVLRYGFPSPAYSLEVRRWKRRNLRHLFRGLYRDVAARALDIGHVYGQLCYAVVAPDGRREDYGLVSMRVVTDAGAARLVDGMQSIAAVDTFKYHGLGAGATAEATSDTALANEVYSFYSSPGVRPTGSQGEGSSSAIYRTVSNVTFGGAVAIAEHGVFSQAVAPGGVLIDRTLTSSISVQSGFTIECDYRLTFGVGG